MKLSNGLSIAKAHIVSLQRVIEWEGEYPNSHRYVRYVLKMVDGTKYYVDKQDVAKVRKVL